MTNGVFMFCHDNTAFEYHRLVPMCAWFVKKHLNVSVTVAADSETMRQIEQIPNIRDVVDNLLEISNPAINGNRSYISMRNDVEQIAHGEFFNRTRSSVYDLSPYDETLVIDLDFIVMNDRLNAVWGSTAPIRVNQQIAGLTLAQPNSTQYVHPLGIPQYWATVMYFRKSPEAKLFFEGIQYVEQNYEYFSRVYRFSHYMFRNDHAVSIVAHAMNGSVGKMVPQWPIQSLPDPVVLFAWDTQPMLQIDQHRAWFVGNDRGIQKTHSVALVRDQSVHVIHKHSLLEVAGPWVAQRLGVQHD